MLRSLKLSRPLAVVDCESTGVDTSTARIIQIAWEVYLPDPDLLPSKCWLLVNPECSIPAEATKVHGITDADVADVETFRQLLPQVSAALAGADIAGFNVFFDIRLLCAEFRRAGLEFQLAGRAVVDCMTIFHQRERRDLAAAAKFYLGCEHNAAHAAAADVAVTASVLDAQLERYTDLPRDMEALAASLRDPEAVDLEGKFVRKNGLVSFNFGKYAGQALVAIAAADPGYLSWMTRQDFLPDTLEIVRQALHPANSTSETLTQ